MSIHIRSTKPTVHAWSAAVSPVSVSDALVQQLGVSLSVPAAAVTVNPVQSSTYTLNSHRNPITFGPGTNIRTKSQPSLRAVIGDSNATWKITNEGHLEGYWQGVYLKGAGTVTNSGAIIGDRFDGLVLVGGDLTNTASGTISGSVGWGVNDYGVGHVTNLGTIAGYVKGGVQLLHGTVTNATGAVISSVPSGDSVGVSVGDNSWVINAGTIVGSLAGVRLGSGSKLNNQASGVIIGEIRGGGAAGTVIINAGTIATGMYLQDGASITNKAGGVVENPILIDDTTSAEVKIDNQAHAVIRGGTLSAIAVITSSTSVTVTNAGAISGGIAVDLFGGAVTNQTGGILNGTEIGVTAAAAAKITNSGRIKGVSKAGVYLNAGGQLTNTGGGSISGATGVSVHGAAGTIINAGSISGSAASIQFSGSGANRLVLQTGSVLLGEAIGSTAGGATNALVLQGSGKSGNRFQNFTELMVQATGSWILTASSSFGTATISAGTLQVGDASHLGARVVIDGALVNKGVIAVGGGSLDIAGAVTGAGSAAISGGTLQLDAGFNEAVAFTGASGVLRLAKSLAYQGLISGFASGDTLDLTNLGFAAGKTTATFDENATQTGGVLTVTNGVHAAHINLAGDFTGATFTVKADGQGGTKVLGPNAAGAALTRLQAFVGAMAGMGDRGGDGDRWISGGSSGRATSLILANPHRVGV